MSDDTPKEGAVATEAPAERGHHPDSPSSLQSSEACPLFLNEQNESRASTSGTLCHQACELEDTSICDTPEQVEAVRKCLEYAKRVGETKYAQAGEVVVLKEIYLSVGRENSGGFVGVTGGFPDLVYIAGHQADIQDWKFGNEPVTETKNNLQGIAYALGLLEKYPQVQDVTVHFYAPNQGWSEAEHAAKYVHTFHRRDAEALELRIRTVVSRKHRANDRLDKSGGEDWRDASPRNSLCIWCARKGDCKKLHSLVISSSEKHSDFVTPTVLNPVQLSKPDQIKLAFKWANQVETIAKAVKARCSNIAKEDDLDLGPELKLSSRTERHVASLMDLFAGAKRAGLSLRDDILPLVSIPFTKVEEAVKKRAAKGKGAEAIRRLQADWEEHGATKLGTPTYFLTEARSPKEKAQNVIEITT
jgi:hypothetical protein